MLRRLAWRLGRKLYTHARGDTPNDPSSNGEYWLLKQLLDTTAAPVTLFDVGANKGDWSAHALELRRSSADLRIHAFEPSRITREALSKRFASNGGVSIEACALSDTLGETAFYCGDDGAGTNSLSSISGSKSETVSLTTVDHFMAQRAMEHVSMVKVDTEGFDLLVLKGAEKTLRHGRVELVQFEYNWRWLINHACLRDVFTFLEGKPYRLGKLMQGSIEFYDEWHFELDRFFENNYVLVRADSTLNSFGHVSRFDPSNAPVPA
jgi:FkbM family methyltransferase